MTATATTAPMLSDLADAYIQRRASRGELGAMTARNHRSYLRRFVAIVSDQAPAEISPKAITRWVTWIGKDSNLTAITRRHHVSAVRTFFRSLVDDGTIAASPFDHLNLRHHPDLARPLVVDLKIVPSPEPVGRLVEPYITERIRRGEVTPLTARNVRGNLHRFAEVCGQRPVNRISRSDVERWLASRPDIAAATRRSELSQVKGFCQWMVRRRHLRVDPTAEIPPIRLPRRLPRAIPADRVARLLSACPDARALLVCLLEVQEGLRCGEVARIQIGDIDFIDRTMRIIGKGGHERFLPVSDETWTALNAYLAEYPATSGPLVRSYLQGWRALHADTISGLVSEWMRAAGIKRRARDGVNAHALRHTSATDMLRAGAHLRDVQHALGHAHLATTEVYLPLVVKDLREAMGGRKYRGAGGVTGVGSRPKSVGDHDR